MPETQNPTPKEVQEVYRDTYNFYTKYIAVKEINWDLVLAESHEIEGRYPFRLTVKILVELINVIELSQGKEVE